MKYVRNCIINPHFDMYFSRFFVLLQKSEGGGLGIGQSNSGGLGDFLSARSTSNILTKTTSFLALCFFDKFFSGYNSK